MHSSAIEKSAAHPEIITESIFALLGHFCVITYAIILTNVLFHIHTYMHTYVVLLLLLLWLEHCTYVLLTCYNRVSSLLYSSLMSFSVASNALTFNEVVSKVTSNRGTLDNLIGPVLDIRRGERWETLRACSRHGISSWDPVHTFRMLPSSHCK